MLIQVQSRSCGNRPGQTRRSLNRSAIVGGRVALSLALSFTAATCACSEDEPGNATSSGNGLSPGGSSSVGVAGQAGAGPSGTGGASATSGAAAATDSERPAQPTAIDMGASEGNEAPSGGAIDAGGVESPTIPDAGPQPDETAFNPCPTDGSPCRIMALGDSITDGLVGNAPGNTGQSVGGYRVELFRQAVADGHEITFVGRNQNGPDTVDGQPFPRNHEGYSGATISTGMNQLANRVDAALAANPPDIVLLHIGTNNLYTGMGPEVPDQLASLIDQITTGAPDALVVVAQITPLAPSFASNGVDQYNALIPGILQERIDAGKHLLLVDVNSAFRAASADVTALVGDTIHPNATGYGIMAQAWYEGIESFLQ
jgi:lysophospholipase L1-like esterase